MELVINIPDFVYYGIRNMTEGKGIIEYNAKSLYNAIYYGTRLSKTHGRLKDVDAFISKVNADRQHSAYVKSWTADDVLSALDNSYAPTIIEANIESER